MPISQQPAKREKTKVKTPVLQGRIDWAHRHFTSLKSLTAARWAGPDSQAARVLKSPLPGRAVLRDACEAGVEQGWPVPHLLAFASVPWETLIRAHQLHFLTLSCRIGIYSRRGKSHLSKLLEWRDVLRS